MLLLFCWQEVVKSKTDRKNRKDKFDFFIGFGFKMNNFTSQINVSVKRLLLLAAFKLNALIAKNQDDEDK